MAAHFRHLKVSLLIMLADNARAQFGSAEGGRTGLQDSLDLEDENKLLSKMSKVLLKTEDASLQVQIAKSEMENTGTTQASTLPDVLASTSGCKLLDLSEGVFESPRYDAFVQPGKMSDKFAVYFCNSGSSLGGTIIVQKKQLCYQDTAEFLHVESDEEGAYASKYAPKYGPDELFCSMHGAEALWLKFHHVNNCVYRSNFSVALPGRFHVHVLHLREAYRGLSQATEWPALHNDLLLGPKGGWVDVGSEALTNELLQRMHNKHGELPVCSCTDLGDGRLVFVGDSIQSLFPSIGDVSRMPHGMPDKPEGWLSTPAHERNVGYDATWQTRNGTASKHIKGLGDAAKRDWHLFVDRDKFAWRPYHCRLKHYSKQEAVQCLNKKSVRIHGDSQHRTLWNTLANWVCDIPPTGPGDRSACHNASMLWERATSNSSSISGQQCTSLHLCFDWEMRFRTEISQSPFKKISDVEDFSILNFGQHQASEDEHVTIKQYRRMLQPIAKTLHQVAGTSKCSRMWGENVPVYRNDRWVRDYKDQRTLHRMQLFNEVAREEFAKVDLAIFPEEKLLMPFLMDGQSDVAHWSENMQLHFVNPLLNMICGGLD